MSNDSKPISLKDFYNQSDVEDQKSDDSIDSQELMKDVEKQLLEKNDQFKKQIRQLPVQSYPIQQSPLDFLSQPSYKPEVKKQESTLTFNQESNPVPNNVSSRIKAFRAQNSQNRAQSPSLNLLEQFISVYKSKIIDTRQEESQLYIEGDDQYPPEEYKQYLQFKEKIQIKRLEEVKQLHEEFTGQLIQEQLSIAQKVEHLVERVQESAQKILIQQEQDIRDQIRQIQIDIGDIDNKNPANIKQVQHSPVKPLQNRFNPLLQNLKLVKDRLNLQTFEPQAINLTPKVKEYQQPLRMKESLQVSTSSLKHSYIQHSPLRVKPLINRPYMLNKSPVFIKRKSPVRESPIRRSPDTYRYRQDLNKQSFSQLEDLIKDIQRNKKPKNSPLKQIQTKKVSGLEVDRVLNVQSINFDLRGRQGPSYKKTPDWNEIIKKSEYFSRSRSNGKDYSERKKPSDDIKNRKSTMQSQNYNNVGKALLAQSNDFYKFTR